jgi:hypothetical protein
MDMMTSTQADEAMTPAGDDQKITQDEYVDFLYEMENQPLAWRATADKEMDYADGNQLDTDLLRAQKALGIPPAMEDLIGPALEAIRGFEVATRTDWRVTPNGQPGGQDVADAIGFKLNEAERQSKADRACSEAFRPQIGVGIGWVEVARESDPFKYPYRCRAIHRNEIHWDMSSRSTDPEEWRYLRRQRWLHPSRLERVFPKHKDLLRQYAKHGATWWATGELDMTGGMGTNLRNAWNEARAWTVNEDRLYNPASKEVCISELWYRRWVDVGVLHSPDGRVVEYDDKNELHNRALATGLVKYSRAVVTRVRRAYWLGPHLLHDGPSPYSHRHFPYVPFFGFTEDNTGVPFGYVRGLIYQQDTLNSGSAKLRWGMSAVRTERTKGAVAMTDAQFRRTVGRIDADIILDPDAMSKPGARFDVKRDFQLTQHQLALLDNARQAIQRISPAASGAFAGRRGTATSGIQEQTQVEQANQSLSDMMDNFKTGRTMVGELLMSMIIEDIGANPITVVIEGDAVTADRTVVINKPEVDPETGHAYLSNDLQRTRLLVSLEDVPSSPSYRGQQLNAMSEAVKSLPPQYQAAAMPFLASLMDVPFKRDLVEALRAAGAQESPEQVEKRIKDEVSKALAQAGHDLKARELDLKERKGDAEIQAIMAQAVQTGVQAAFAAMQAGQVVATMPMVAPVADAIMQGAGYRRPTPAGQDPNFPTAPQTAAVNMPAPYVQGEGQGAVPPVRENTSPEFPPVPQQADTGMNGIETPRTSDNVPPNP